MSAPLASPTPTRTDERLFKRDFVVLLCGHFLQALGYSSMLLLPLYLAHLGATRTQIGVQMAVTSVAGLLSRPAVGWALDNAGRKPSLIIGTLLLVGSMAIVWFVTAIDEMIYLQRILAGIGLGTLFTAYFTCAADLVPATRRTEGLAIFGVSGLVPLLVNPFADQLGIAAHDVRWFLPALGAVTALSLVAIVLLREPPRTSGAQAFTARGAVAALSRRELWPVWLAVTVLAALVSLFQAFATVTAEQRGLPSPSTVWLSYALGAAGVRIFGAKLPDRVGPHRMVVPALGSYLAGALVMAGAADLRGVLLAGLLAGIGHGYCFPVLTGQVVTRVAESFRGSALASFTALWSAAELAASPALGAIADRWGDAAMFRVGAAVGAASLGAWWLLERRFGHPFHTGSR
jgi:MFS family permease